MSMLAALKQRYQEQPSGCSATCGARSTPCSTPSPAQTLYGGLVKVTAARTKSRGLCRALSITSQAHGG